MLFVRDKSCLVITGPLMERGFKNPSLIKDPRIQSFAFQLSAAVEHLSVSQLICDFVMLHERVLFFQKSHPPVNYRWSHDVPPIPKETQDLSSQHVYLGQTNKHDVTPSLRLQCG